MTEDKKLLVSAIKNGTVIDHIEAGRALKIIQLLNLASHKQIVTVGLNLPSTVMERKDLVKIENLRLTPEQINNIAILAPNATINIIADYKVIKKFPTEIPEIINHVIICPNPKCITNNEAMETRFNIFKEKEDIVLRCHYCEKEYAKDEIGEYKNN